MAKTSIYFCTFHTQVKTPPRWMDASSAVDTLSLPAAWLAAQQGTAATVILTCSSAVDGRCDRSHRSGWYQSRSRPPLSNSIDICTQGSPCHAWDRAVQCTWRGSNNITFHPHSTCTGPPTFEQDGHTSSAALYSSLPATASAQ